MRYVGSKTTQISFPLGGIGSGCIGFAGNGRLTDWEIFNSPNKNSLNGLSHFSLRVEQEGEVRDLRVLQGDLPAPYTGIPELNDSIFEGFGWGPRVGTLCGLPHFREHEFYGEFPAARLILKDPDCPAQAEIGAWSPFIPGSSADSSRPLAVFDITVENTAAAAADFTLCGVLSNPWGGAEAVNRVVREGECWQLVLERGGDPEDFSYGELALTTAGADVSYQEYFYRGGWNDSLESYYYDWRRPGHFRNRSYAANSGQTPDTGLIAVHFTLGPGEKKSIPFIISWHIPNCRNSECPDAAVLEGVANRWRNYYASLQTDAAAGGRYALENLDRLRRETFLFRDALHASTLPPAVLDGVAANLAVLRSPTCMRLEDGTFYAWEGAGNRRGSCPGSCAHVWNYAQALPFLFPDLERSMRMAQYFYNVDVNGGAHFRLKVPLGRKAAVEDQRPCVDGLFGEVMKTFREWKISGDTEWLRTVYPQLKRTVEYAWSDKNYDRWDPEKSGVIRGRQHNTLDMELFGANGWLNAHYLGGLKAAALMADALGDGEFAAECRDVFARGKEWTDKNLFNGAFYFQDLDLDNKDILAPFTDHDAAADIYWDAEHGQIKYQFGRGGCAIDAPLAQFYATLYGLGEVLDLQQTETNLRTLYRENFRSMRSVANTWRNYCLNDEKGTMICTWPDMDTRPAIPACYSTETMHGFEWAFAAQLVLRGMTAEGTEVAAAIRERYDGEKRNPWNEIECGSNYARSLASFALLPAFSGFTFDMTQGQMGFAPAAAGDGEFFWSLGTAWGSFRKQGGRAELRVLHGGLRLLRFDIAAPAEGWQKISVSGADGNRLETADNFRPDAAGVSFSAPLILAAGATLTLEGV